MMWRGMAPLRQAGTFWLDQASQDKADLVMAAPTI